MSTLLSKPTVPVIPVSQRLQTEMREIVMTPRATAEFLFKVWSDRFDKMWATGNGITPADRLAFLDTRAADLLQRSANLAAFMIQELGDSDPEMTAAIQTRLQSLPPYTIHQDGTVTLD